MDPLTEDKSLQAGLEDLQRFTLPTIDHLAIAAAWCSVDGTLKRANHPALQLLPDLVPGKSRLFELIADHEDAAVLRSLYAQDSRSPQGWALEVRARTSSLTDSFLEVTGLPGLDPGDGSPGWLVIFRNVTERTLHTRELEIYAQELSQLYQSNRQHLQALEEASKARDHFYALVSHELKTPLTSLKAALEMLGTAAGKSDPQLIRQLEKIMSRSAFRLDRAINDLLDLSTARSGGLQLDFSPVDIGEVILGVIGDVTPILEEKHLSIEMPEIRESIIVRGNVLRLQQIMQNLLINASKAAPQSTEIKVHLEGGREQAKVSVSNVGQLDPVVASSLFEPFKKSSAGGYQTGAGLGLSVVHAMVTAHGGTVRGTSERKHVTFTFTVPLWRKEGAV